jgi:hypothetical protein
VNPFSSAERLPGRPYIGDAGRIGYTRLLNVNLAILPLLAGFCNTFGAIARL